MLNGKVAVITGAGRGIGRAIAQGYARAGASVVCSSRSMGQIEETVRLIQENGGTALAVQADSASHDDMIMLFERAASAFGGVDIAVVNAGVSPENKLVSESTPALWKQTIDVNLTGAFYTAQCAIPHMRKRGAGKIIFMGSGMGHRSGPTRSAYAASKAGLWMLTRVLAQELVNDNIGVNELVPGPVADRLRRGSCRCLAGSHRQCRMVQAAR